MSVYLLRRLGQSLVLLLLISAIGFAILHLAPGGPLAQFALTPGMTQADLARIAHQMGLDRPLPVQYWEWFRRMLLGDWGHSYRDGQPVLAVIGSSPRTIQRSLRRRRRTRGSRVGVAAPSGPSFEQ